ncbi:hypothetical protein [Variovorax sp. UMC13]|uniref:hypothetical protein n=1 Tax=Variovorax sp. UMC13 TaxID=1862326 RepID=UPI0015FF4BC0|nr:hypothetical protein [Variovorax sp. UMC13]MBB1601576.1 hypothetical protein [Variovorax sp. UMC13]
MAALSADRNTPRRAGALVSDPVAAATVIFAGSLYALNAAGNAVPATAGGTRVRAVAEQRADNTGGAIGAVRTEGARGVYRFANSTGAAELKRPDIGGVAFVADDQTVSKTGTAVAGTVVDIDDGEVWVDVGTASVTTAAP